MTKFEELFVYRFLKTHEKYLKSIADIAAHLYFHNYNHLEYGCENIINKLSTIGNYSETKNVQSDTCFRNLRNAWYHEVVFSYHKNNLTKQNYLNHQFLFAPWKIIQSYYIIFAGISALVRAVEKKPKKSNDYYLNIFGHNFLSNNERKIFFLPPYNFYLNQQGYLNPEFERMVNWEHASQEHFPYIKTCLLSVYKKYKRQKLITIPHYLKELRNWAQYEDVYLFFQLYGKTVKENLDFSLKRITYGYLVQFEFFLIKVFGWEQLKSQYNTFKERLEQNLKIQPENLSKRFEIYQKILAQ